EEDASNARADFELGQMLPLCRVRQHLIISDRRREYRERCERPGVAVEQVPCTDLQILERCVKVPVIPGAGMWKGALVARSDHGNRRGQGQTVREADITGNEKPVRLHAPEIERVRVVVNAANDLQRREPWLCQV